MATNPNYDKLREWKKEHHITDLDLGARLGCSKAYARLLCCQDRIPTVWHKKLVSLGFPAELLPRAEDVPMGLPRGYRFPKAAPIYPGLQKNTAAQV